MVFFYISLVPPLSLRKESSKVAPSTVPAGQDRVTKSSPAPLTRKQPPAHLTLHNAQPCISLTRRLLHSNRQPRGLRETEPNRWPRWPQVRSTTTVMGEKEFARPAIDAGWKNPKYAYLAVHFGPWLTTCSLCSAMDPALVVVANQIMQYVSSGSAKKLKTRFIPKGLSAIYRKAFMQS